MSVVSPALVDGAVPRLSKCTVGNRGRGVSPASHDTPAVSQVMPAVSGPRRGRQSIGRCRSAGAPEPVLPTGVAECRHCPR